MIIIVTGMHRSGTSALAGMLHHNGVLMGNKKSFYPPPLPENPKGFYENVYFRLINDFLLKPYEIKSFDPDIPIVKEPKSELQELMKSLIHQHSLEIGYWGFKDPRTSLTLDAWLSVIDEPYRLLITDRPDEYIADSLCRRSGKYELRDQYLKTAQIYRDRLERYDGLRVPYKDLCERPDKWAEIIGKYLDFPIANTNFIDPNLNHNRGN